jgi:hypothetical protein
LQPCGPESEGLPKTAPWQPRKIERLAQIGAAAHGRDAAIDTPNYPEGKARVNECKPDLPSGRGLPVGKIIAPERMPDMRKQKMFCKSFRRAFAAGKVGRTPDSRSAMDW